MNFIPPYIYQDGEICRWKVRRTFFGKYVVQIQRAVCKKKVPPIVMDDDAPAPTWQPCGQTEWRDVKDSDMQEFYKFMEVQAS